MYKVILLLIFFSFILRVLFIYQGSVSFHYDMARDAFAVQQIWKEHHFKILGPPTSTPGLYHGVLYYYLIAPFYLLGQGDPRVVAIFLSFLNSLTVIPVMFLAKDLSKSKKWAILGGFIFAVSFESTQYGPWISNPAPALLTVALFFLCLRSWQKGNILGLYLAVLSAALSAQFQFFLIYLFLLIPLFGIIFRLRVSSKSIGVSLLIIIFGMVNFFIAAIKFNSVKNIFLGFLNIGSSGQIDFRPQFAEVLLNFINRFSEIFISNFFPTSVFLGGILAIVVIYFIKREYVLLFFLFSNLPIAIFGGHSNTYVNIGLVVPAVLSVLLLLQNIWKVNKGLVCVFLFLSLLSNIMAIFKYNPDGQIILVIPNDMNLKNELQLINKTYEIANGQPFSINTLTLPLWTNTTWAYLYSWYGKNKYGYVPYFYGHDQVGLLGAESLPRTEKPFDKTFFIVEPHVGIPEDRYGWEVGSEDSKTELISQYDFGELKLQFRKPTKESKVNE